MSDRKRNDPSIVTGAARWLRGGRRVLATLVLAGILAPFGGDALAQAAFYRYTDEKGRTVVVGQMPPEHVARGYEVLNAQMQVIEVVPPQLTEEEQSKADAERRRKLEEERLKAWDMSLMRRYSSVEDIEAARDRAVHEIKVRISILRSNLISTKNQIEREQAKAADIERRGREVPDVIIQAVDTLQQEIASIEESIAARREEIEQVKAEYQKDIDRFKELKPQVDFRRKESLGGRSGTAY